MLRTADPERALEPGDIPELIEFPPDGVEDADRTKAEPLVQRQRCGIGKGDSGHQRLDILALECVEQRSVQR